MSRVIGIDLGTTNSCVAIIDGGEAVVIPNAEGSRTTPSVVGFGESERFVGQVAKRQAVTNPANTVYAVKRLIGRRVEDAEVVAAQNTATYKIVSSDNGDAWVEVQGRTYAPAEVSAIVLSNMREVAEAFLNEEVTDAVITVPAYFNDSQRQATRDAGRIAGLNVLRIINEPTAASLAYGLGSDGSPETIAVYDLGGGTFDVSILQLGDGLYEVLATNGDTFLGGEDFDNRIIELLADEFTAEHGTDPRDDPMALQRLREAAERAKHELSVAEQTEVHLPFLAAGADGPVHLIRQIGRGELEAICEDLVERSLGPCTSALEDCGLSIGDITQVVLVGGQTRMPLVQQRVSDFFGREPNRGVNPDEVVAVGAAVQGAVLLGEIDEVILLDVTPLSLGIETAGGTYTPLIERNTPIPCQASDVFTNTVDNQNMVSVHVLQGERPMAEDNHSLARFELYDIPAGPRGSAQIEVTFNIDVNGMVSVSAKDLLTGQENTVRVVASGGLSEDDIDRMVGEADAQRDADLLRAQKADLANKVSGLIYTTEKSVTEYGSYLQPNEAEAIQDVIEYARACSEDPAAYGVDDLETALANLEQSAQRVAEAMYAAMMYEDGGES